MADALVQPGIVVASDGLLAVNVGGRILPADWLTGYIPATNDAVRVIVADGRATVLGGVLATQRPLTGTVAGAPVSGKVPVTTSVGTLDCRYTGTAPTTGELVRLAGDTREPWIWPSVAATVPPPPESEEAPQAPAPPPSTSTGTSKIAAVQSGSWQSDGWNNFAGTDVVQWRYGSNRENRGAWFYGSRPDRLKGAVVKSAQVRLGPRLRIGSHTASMTLHLYRHTNRTRPSGDVSRVDGPHDVTLPPNTGARWVDIPVAWAQSIVDSGGGLGVLGSPYGGVQGIGNYPASGQLLIEWER